MITRKIPVNLWNLVSSWSALHQERLDGSGYPFHIQADDLPLGARLMAVADVFTASPRTDRTARG